MQTTRIFQYDSFENPYIIRTTVFFPNHLYPEKIMTSIFENAVIYHVMSYLKYACFRLIYCVKNLG